MASEPQDPSSTVEEVFRDYSGRRAGVLRALISDFDKFYEMCDPVSESFCLYGLPDGQWEVRQPVEGDLLHLPQPAKGINRLRNEDRWLLYVAVHCDSWLLAVAFFLAADFSAKERKELFNLISSLPTVYDAVYANINQVNDALYADINQAKDESDIESKQAKNNPGIESRSKSKQSTKESSSGQAKANFKSVNEVYAEDDDENSENICGTCHGIYDYLGQFWVVCNSCKRWNHGKCVKITPADVEKIKQYKCRSCSSNKENQYLASP